MQEAWIVSLSGDGREGREDAVMTLAEVADEIAASTQTYERYGFSLSNAQRSQYACTALGLSAEDFSILLPLPFDEWLVSDDLALIRTGLFILDMRHDAITGTRDQLHLPLSWMFEEQAEAEFYAMEFFRIAARKEQGKLIGEVRRLH